MLLYPQVVELYTPTQAVREEPGFVKKKIIKGFSFGIGYGVRQINTQHSQSWFYCE